MECPACGSSNITSTGLGTGVWQCFKDGCGKKFNRDTALDRSMNRQKYGSPVK